MSEFSYLTDQGEMLRLPEYSDWECQLFGGGADGIVWRPLKGREPNAFHRWMHRIFFACVWVRRPSPTEERGNCPASADAAKDKE